MAIGSIIGGLIGGKKAGAKEDAANANMAAALEEFRKIKAPTIAEQEITPEMFQYLQDYLPQLENSENLGPSGYEDISVDPRLQQQQMQALEQLSELSNGGLSAADIAGLQQVRRGAAAEAEAKQGQILQEMQQRGQGGSGAELIARLKSAQSGADRQSAESLEIAKQAQERALQALTGGASLAGQVRGQEFGEQADVAKAKDLVNQFNTQNRQAVQTRNVGAQNQGQQLNNQNRQNIANQNTAQRNNAEQYNKQLSQQQFQNQMQRAGGMSGQYNNMAGAQNQQAGRIAQTYAGIGQGVDQIGAAMLSDETTKENLEPAGDDIQEFLDKLSSKKFNFKQGYDTSDKDHYGITAQDMERSDAGKSAVTEIDGKKHIDVKEALGLILASQSEINKRLKSLEGK